MIQHYNFVVGCQFGVIVRIISALYGDVHVFTNMDNECCRRKCSTYCG
jgi:hypothetical protein